MVYKISPDVFDFSYLTKTSIQQFLNRGAKVGTIESPLVRSKLGLSGSVFCDTDK